MNQHLWCCHYAALRVELDCAGDFENDGDDKTLELFFEIPLKDIPPQKHQILFNT